MQKYVEIVGVIGAGKSALAKLFNETANYQAIFEREEDRKRMFFAEQFLLNPQRYGFEGILNFLAFHLNRTLEKLQGFQENSSVINDASVLMQWAYGKACLNEDEQETIARIITHAYRKIPKVDLWVVLHLPSDINVERIVSRNRGRDSEVSCAFIESTGRGLDEALERFGGKTPVLKLDSSKLDWVHNQHDQKVVFDLVENKLGQ